MWNKSSKQTTGRKRKLLVSFLNIGRKKCNRILIDPIDNNNIELSNDDNNNNNNNINNNNHKKKKKKKNKFTHSHSLQININIDNTNHNDNDDKTNNNNGIEKMYNQLDDDIHPPSWSQKYLNPSVSKYFGPSIVPQLIKKYILQRLKHPSSQPISLCLNGCPGTGKTLLMNLVASELGLQQKVFCHESLNGATYDSEFIPALLCNGFRRSIIIIDGAEMLGTEVLKRLETTMQKLNGNRKCTKNNKNIINPVPSNPLVFITNDHKKFMSKLYLPYHILSVVHVYQLNNVKYKEMIQYILNTERISPYVCDDGSWSRIITTGQGDARYIINQLELLCSKTKQENNNKNSRTLNNMLLTLNGKDMTYNNIHQSLLYLFYESPCQYWMDGFVSQFNCQQILLHILQTYINYYHYYYYYDHTTCPNLKYIHSFIDQMAHIQEIIDRHGPHTSELVSMYIFNVIKQHKSSATSDDDVTNSKRRYQDNNNNYHNWNNKKKKVLNLAKLVYGTSLLDVFFRSDMLHHMSRYDYRYNCKEQLYDRPELNFISNTMSEKQIMVCNKFTKFCLT